jgi:hypothetical protein
MGSDPAGERIHAVIGVPAELLEYERWLADRRKADRTEKDYLFSEERARFEPRKDDVVVVRPGVHPGKIGGVSTEAAALLIGLMDGQRCLLEVRLDSGVEQDTFSRFLRATFGSVVFAPEAVDTLEASLPGVEITRFPSPPYSIERPYWENMVAVRQRFLANRAALGNAAHFVRLLRELHVIATMGKNLDNFYKPASPVSDRVVAPGALFEAPTRTSQTPRGTLYFDGPRVNASLIGGEAYHRAVYKDAGDVEACSGKRDLSHDGVAWGRIVTARSERETQPKPWFLPPRPMLDAHFDFLRTELARAFDSAEAKDRAGAVRSVARFHQAFVRLHPFHCANQSIAMNLVNAVLARLHGAGIPHFILDHMALRVSTPTYEEIFARAVSAWLVAEGQPARRLATLSDRKTRVLSFIERSKSENLGALVTNDPEAARWALLRA